MGNKNEKQSEIVKVALVKNEAKPLLFDQFEKPLLFVKEPFFAQPVKISGTVKTKMEGNISTNSVAAGAEVLEKILVVKSDIETQITQVKQIINQDMESIRNLTRNTKVNADSARQSETNIQEIEAKLKGGENMSKQEEQPKGIDVKRPTVVETIDSTNTILFSTDGRPLIVGKPIELGGKTIVADKPVVGNKDTGDKPLKVKKGLSTRQKVGLVGTAIVLGITGAYFFPRPGNNTSPDENKNVPGEKTGTAGEQLSPSEAHAQRLIELNKIFDEKGVNNETIAAWLKAAGISGNIQVDARQIEQEIVKDQNGQDRIVASGIQVEGSNINLNWPNVLTTDQFVAKSSRSYQPDPKNPSVIYTGIINYKGKGTAYVDGQNWSQMAPKK